MRRGKRAGLDRADRLLRNYLIPAALAAVTVGVMVWLLAIVNFDIIHGNGSSAIVFASFATSAVIMFMTPRSHSARTRRLIGSYAIATAFGLIGYFMLPYLPFYVVTGIVVLATALALVAADVMHPPAIGIAFAFVIYQIGLDGALIVGIGLSVLIFVRAFLERFVFVIEEDVLRAVEGG